MVVITEIVMRLRALKELKTENFHWIKWYMLVEFRIILKSYLSNKYSIKGRSILIRTYMAIVTLVGLNDELIF